LYQKKVRRLLGLVLLIWGGLLNVSKKWNMPVANWSLIIGQLDILFTSRLKLDLAKKEFDM
jgi:hypothetical protein